MAFEDAKAMLGEAAVKRMMRYLSGDPELNLIKLTELGERYAIEEGHKATARRWREFFSDKDSNWRGLALRLFEETSPNVRETLAVNYLVNSGIISSARRRTAEEQHKVHVPWAILIDPTGKCNLRCKGCWAAEYDKTKDMDFATLDRVLTEAEDLGIRFFVVSGGEPTMRMDDLITLAAKHNESVFHVFTNGTLITRDVAKRVEEIGNITFAISIEGLEVSTNARRGRGVFTKVMTAMDNLSDVGVVFGFSATYTRRNTEEIAGDEFIDLMIAKGCTIGWLFTYVPVGGGTDLDYMATPEQRARMYRKVQEWRSTKPIFVADFWNDGEAVGGCIAGGKCYFHINSAGDVEPCAFVHYSNMNIKDHSVLDALRSPLFAAYQRNQPFNHNLLRPCPIIDNPECLERVVSDSGAYPTQSDGASAAGLSASLRDYADGWGKVANELWRETRVKKVSDRAV